MAAAPNTPTTFWSSLTSGFLLLAMASLLTACGAGSDGEPASMPMGSSDNPYTVPFSSPAYLREHARYLEEELFRIGDTPVWDYNTPNRGFGNVIMIEGDDGVIIVDTTTAHEHAAVAEKAFREITSKPVAAVIYTHHHADHISGAGAFIDPAAAASGAVPVIAADNFLRELEDENQVTAPIMGLRAMYMYGQLLDPVGDGRDYHVSCCGYTLGGQRKSYIAPNQFIADRQELTIAGVRMELFQTGGESASHLAIWLPDYRVMLSGDELQGPNYPNLHSLRGTKPRDAMKWIGAIDRMRAYGAEHLVPSHGQPLSGADVVEDTLTIYRDAIQFTHDQSLRLINKGYTPDDLANAIALPDFMDRDPWTREMYGTVKHNVREYYVAYISWWNGDPAELDPLPRVEKARRLVELMAARHLKAAALRRIGFATANTNWRGFYLTAARELEGTVQPRRVVEQLQQTRFSPDDLTMRQLLSLLRFRVDSAKAGDRHLAVAYHLTDTQEAYTLELRNAILDIHEGVHPEADVTLTLERPVLNRLFTGELSYRDALKQGSMALSGAPGDLRAFGQVFDLDPGQPYLSLR